MLIDYRASTCTRNDAEYAHDVKKTPLKHEFFANLL